MQAELAGQKGKQPGSGSKQQIKFKKKEKWEENVQSQTVCVRFDGAYTATEVVFADVGFSEAAGCRDGGSTAGRDDGNIHAAVHKGFNT